MNELDQRNNAYIYATLNGLFFWEIRKIIQIEGWKEQYASELPRWLTAIAHMDALCSLATFAYNHPDYHPVFQSPRRIYGTSTDEPRQMCTQ